MLKGRSISRRNKSKWRFSAQDMGLYVAFFQRTIKRTYLYYQIQGFQKRTLQVPMTFNFVLGNEDTVQVLAWNPQEIRSAHICVYSVFPKVLTYIMDVFRRVRKIAKTDYYLRHICPPIRLFVRKELGSRWTNFHEIW